jgi:hypothetical protein
MHSVQLLALGALTRFAVAQTCTRDVEITEPTQVISCTVVDADVIVDEALAGAVTIDGPEEIRGALTVRNATGLLSLTSNTIESIDGVFAIDNCENLGSINMGALREISELRMNRLTLLRSLIFGSEGVTKANVVVVSDTHLDSLTGLKLATVDSININNNARLANFESDLVNVTESLIINNNGDSFEISLPLLETAAQIEVANTRSFTAPLLESVSKSLLFDMNPEMESFSAPNLTKVEQDVSFINNEALANVSLPLLTEITGGLTVINNTELLEVDGFPELRIVGGGIILGGNFESVSLPSLEDVVGSVNVSSTTDIEEFCEVFNEAANDGRIQGQSNCDSENEDALEGGNNGGSGGSGGDDDDEGSAGLLGVNFVVLGLSLVAGVAQLL